MEIVDYATYDSPTVMFDVMGFGKSLDDLPMLLQPGVLSLAWGSVVRQLAAGLGIELDEVTETHIRIPAPRISRSRPATSPKARPRPCVSRYAAWSAAIPRWCSSTSPGCVTICARTGLSPAQEGGSYRVEVTGEPSYAMDLCLSSRKGDHNHAGLVATAARGRQRDTGRRRGGPGDHHHAGSAPDHR